MTYWRKWRKTLFLARLEHDYSDEDKPKYQIPIKLDNINYKPIDSESEMVMFGLNSKDIQKAVILSNQKEYHQFKKGRDEGSKVYLDGASPTVKPDWDILTEGDVEPIPRYWANYEIDSIQDFVHTKHIFFRRKSGSSVY